MTSGIESSLQRAQDRLAQLSVELEGWVATQKAPLRHKHDADAGVHEWRIEAPAELPSTLAGGVGEVIAGLRIALDDTVRAVVGAPGDQSIVFPVTTSPGEFEQVAAAQLAGASEGLRVAIEAYQLYQAPPTALVTNLGVLARLTWLSVNGQLDAQVIIAAGVDSRSIEVTASQDGASASVTAGYGIGKPANGELALRVEVTPPEATVQVKPFDPPSLVVAFGDDQSRVAIPDLQNLVATVAQIQAELAQYAGAAAGAAPAAAAPLVWPSPEAAAVPEVSATPPAPGPDAAAPPAPPAPAPEAAAPPAPAPEAAAPAAPAPPAPPSAPEAPAVPAPPQPPAAPGPPNG